jgi:hypothetical protein
MGARGASVSRLVLLRRRLLPKRRRRKSKRRRRRGQGEVVTASPTNAIPESPSPPLSSTPPKLVGPFSLREPPPAFPLFAAAAAALTLWLRNVWAGRREERRGKKRFPLPLDVRKASVLVLGNGHAPPPPATFVRVLRREKTIRH